MHPLSRGEVQNLTLARDYAGHLSDAKALQAALVQVDIDQDNYYVSKQQDIA